jgi:hypothetical protein
MPDLKQQLTELIDAFATARSTGNQLLTQQSAQALVQFLEGVSITLVKLEENDGSEG